MSMFLILPDGHDITYPVVDFLFKSYDNDGDGRIGHTELCAFLTHCGLLIHELGEMDDDVQSITADSYSTEEFIQLLHKDTLEVQKLHRGLHEGGVYEQLFNHLDIDGSGMLEPMEMFQFLKKTEIDVNNLFRKKNKKDMREANHLGYHLKDFVKVMSRFDKEDLMKVVKFSEIKKADALTGLEWFENTWHILDFLLSILIVVCLCTEHEVEEMGCTSAYHMMLTYAILKGVSYLFKSMVWACMGLTAGLGETQYIVAVCPLISWGLSSMAKHAVVVGASHEYWRQSALGGDGECWDQVHDKSPFFEIIFYIVIIRGLVIIAMLLIVWMLIPLLAIFIAGYAKGARHASEATVDGMSSIVAGLIEGNDVGNSKTVFGINGMLSALGVRSFVQGIKTEDVLAAKRKQAGSPYPPSPNSDEIPRSFTYPINRPSREARGKNRSAFTSASKETAQRQLPALLVDQLSSKVGVKRSVASIFTNVVQGFMNDLPTDMDVHEKMHAVTDKVVDTCRSLSLAGETDIASMLPSDPFESLRYNARSMSKAIAQLGDDAIGDERWKLEKQLEEVNATLKRLKDLAMQNEKDNSIPSLPRASTMRIQKEPSEHSAPRAKTMRVQKYPIHSESRSSVTMPTQKDASIHSEEPRPDITERQTHLYSEPRPSNMDTNHDIEMLALEVQEDISSEIRPDHYEKAPVFDHNSQMTPHESHKLKSQISSNIPMESDDLMMADDTPMTVYEHVLENHKSETIRHASPEMQARESIEFTDQDPSAL